MELCAYVHDWPPSPPVAHWPSSVKYLSLDWPAVASYSTWPEQSEPSATGEPDARRLPLAAIELPPVDVLDDASCAHLIDEAEERLRVVHSLGAPIAIVSVAGSGYTEPDVMVGFLTRLTVLAKQMDVQLCLRNMCGSPLAQLDELHQVFAATGSAAPRLCLDNLECQRAAVNPADAVLNFAGRISFVRLRDDANGRSCPPGQGTGHVLATLDCLREEQFTGLLLVDTPWLADAADRLQSYLSPSSTTP